MNLEVLKQKNFNEPLESKAEEEFVSHECCCCKKIFENEIKLNDHEKECDFKKYQILKKSHGCFFKNCNKFFKKSTDLRKHEVRLDQRYES